MHSHYTNKDLAGLPGMPATPRGVLFLAKRQGWVSQRRLGSKSREYLFDVLPKETQEALIKREFRDVKPEPVSAPNSMKAVHAAISKRVVVLEQLIAAAAAEVRELKLLMGVDHA